MLIQKNKMANEYFKFKQFTIFHDRCAMKVGTDGVLLGAWAEGGTRILDVGAGTGLISLMAAQRFTSAVIDAVEIDADAVSQAIDNVNNSDFRERISVLHYSLSDFVERCKHEGTSYDCIISNPPFYTEDTECPENKRNAARHTDSLPYSVLFRCVSAILSEGGVFSVIVPYSSKDKITFEACLSGLFVKDICCIKTTPRKPIKRIMMSFSNVRPENTKNEEKCLMNQYGSKSDWFKQLTEDFYL